MTPSQIAKNLIERIDEKIVALDIRAALEKSIGKEEVRPIQITVTKGSTTLTGRIASWEHFFAAQKALSRFPAAGSVRNDLVVVADGLESNNRDDMPRKRFVMHGDGAM